MKRTLSWCALSLAGWCERETGAPDHGSQAGERQRSNSPESSSEPDKPEKQVLEAITQSFVKSIYVYYDFYDLLSARVKLLWNTFADFKEQLANALGQLVEGGGGERGRESKRKKRTQSRERERERERERVSIYIPLNRPREK